MSRVFFALALLIPTIVWSATQFDDWIVGEQTTIAFAKTENDQAHTLGILCLDAGDCRPYLNNQAQCHNGQSYPALISTGGHTVSATLSCLHVANQVVFLLPSSHRKLIIENTRYAVAMGTQGDTFITSAFSLSGSAKAIIALQKQMTPHPGEATQAQKQKHAI